MTTIKYAPRFTKRERQIAQLLTTGDSQVTIARQLGISTRTVYAHASNLRQKMGETTTFGAAIKLATWQQLTAGDGDDNSC